jgi:hypothetical protein
MLSTTLHLLVHFLPTGDGWESWRGAAWQGPKRGTGGPPRGPGGDRRRGGGARAGRDGGSDYHGRFKPDLQVGVGPGDLDVAGGVLEELRDRIPMPE